MHKKLLAAIALTTVFFGQSVWCEDGPYEAVDIKHKQNILFISGNSDQYSVNLGDYLSGQINQIQFSGPSGSYSIKGTTFDGLEKAAPKLVINLKGATDIDWVNLDKAMKEYENKYRHRPTIIAPHRFIKIFFLNGFASVKFASVYNPLKT